MSAEKWWSFCPGLNVLSKVQWTCNIAYNDICQYINVYICMKQNMFIYCFPQQAISTML